MAITTRIGMFPARLAFLENARAFLDDFCADAGVGSEPCRQLKLVVEELFRNTVKHGHRGGSDAPVWIELEHATGSIRLTYEDRAQPFNSLAQATRAQGRLGDLFAQGLTRDSDYAHLFGRNRTRIVLSV